MTKSGAACVGRAGHDALFDHVDQLYRTGLLQPVGAWTVEALHALGDELRRRFGTEDALMARSGYPDAERHRCAHVVLLGGLGALAERLDRGEHAQFRSRLPDFLHQLLTHKIRDDGRLLRHLSVGRMEPARALGVVLH